MRDLTSLTVAAATLAVAIRAGALAGDKQPATDKGPDQQKSQHFEREITITVKLDYLLYLPAGYDDDKKEWPLVVFLHGSGERGDDLDKVKIHGPPKLIAEGKQFPF